MGVKLRAEVTEIPISEIRPYENNPRLNDRAVPMLMESIRTFGFNVPIIIDKDNVVIAGHTRLKAAERLGMKTVPCVRAEDLSEEQAQAYRLADNKVSELSTWDNEKLSDELMQLAGGIDMSLFGFEVPREEIPGKEDEAFTNTEFSLDDFEDDKFSHQCERCGFKWN